MQQSPTLAQRNSPIARHSEARRGAACRAFWSSHPLNLAFRRKHGTDTFSLKEFVAFVIAMPADQFLALTGEGVR